MTERFFASVKFFSGCTTHFGKTSVLKIPWENFIYNLQIQTVKCSLFREKMFFKHSAMRWSHLFHFAARKVSFSMRWWGAIVKRQCTCNKCRASWHTLKKLLDIIYLFKGWNALFSKKTFVCSGLVLWTGKIFINYQGWVTLYQNVSFPIQTFKLYSLH